MKKEDEIHLINLLNRLSKHHYKGNVPDELFNDEEFMMKAVKLNGILLYFGSNKIKSNIKIVKEAINNNIGALDMIDEKLLNNEDLISEFINYYPDIYEKISSELKCNLHFAFIYFTRNSDILNLSYKRNFITNIYNKKRSIPFNILNNKELFMKVVSINGDALIYASKDLQNDIEVVFLAVSNKWSAIKNMNLDINRPDLSLMKFVNRNDEFKSINDNKLIVFIAIKNSPKAFNYISLRLREKLECFLIIKKHCENFKIDLPSKPTNDNNFMLNCLTNNPFFYIPQTSIEFRSNAKLMLKIIKKYHRLIDYAHCLNDNNKHFIIECLKYDVFKNPEDIIPYKTLNNPDIILVLAKNFRDVKYKKLIGDLNDDKEFMKKLVEIDGKKLIYASKRLQIDKEIVKIALKNDGKVIKNIHSSLLNDEELVMIAIQTFSKAIFYSKNLNENRNIFLELKKADPDIFYSFYDNDKKNIKYNNKYFDK